MPGRDAKLPISFHRRRRREKGHHKFSSTLQTQTQVAENKCGGLKKVVSLPCPNGKSGFDELFYFSQALERRPCNPLEPRLLLDIINLDLDNLITHCGA